jgi:hypothetical protein
MKILSELRNQYKEADKKSLNKSERLIRRRICIETMRYKYYDTYNSILSLEFISIPIIMLGLYIFFTILAINMGSIYIILYSSPIITMLWIRRMIVKRAIGIRVRMELYKIKKVLDSINDDDEIPTKLFFWIISSSGFVNEIGNLIVNK